MQETCFFLLTGPWGWHWMLTHYSSVSNLVMNYTDISYLCMNPRHVSHVGRMWGYIILQWLILIPNNISPIKCYTLIMYDSTMYSCIAETTFFTNMIKQCCTLPIPRITLCLPVHPDDPNSHLYSHNRDQYSVYRDNVHGGSSDIVIMPLWLQINLKWNSKETKRIFQISYAPDINIFGKALNH
jgi:hypothetical protein